MITLRDVVIVHFALNPDDTLTVADICAKTDRNEKSVYDAASTMVRDGMLVTRRIENTTFFYIGPALKRMAGLPTEVTP